jgi:hypothetical protein
VKRELQEAIDKEIEDINAAQLAEQNIDQLSP